MIGFLDETPTEIENDRIAAGSDEIRDHLRLIHLSLDAMGVVARDYKHSAREELLLLQLAVRMFNAGNACLKLARAGYYHQAFTLVRDIVEIQFLLNRFAADRAQVTVWMNATAKDRHDLFSPRANRDYLDKRDGFTTRLRQKAYSSLSNFGAHATPEGFAVISVNGLTQVGPFPSERVLIGVSQEMARHFPFAALLMFGILPEKDGDDGIWASIIALQDGVDAWRAKYQPPAPDGSV